MCMYVVYGIFLYTQQGTATQEQSLFKARESQLKDKVKTLEAMKSELETENETLQKQMMQLVEVPASGSGQAHSLSEVRIYFALPEPLLHSKYL